MSHEAITETDLQEVMPATASRLVVMLYDGAIASLHQAVESIEAGDLEGRRRAINMTLDIIANLCLALDMENGGEVAENLSKLYGFMITRLQRANLLNDPAPIADVLRILEPLYEAWRELNRKVTEESHLQKFAGQHEVEPARAAG